MRHFLAAAFCLAAGLSPAHAKSYTPQQSGSVPSCPGDKVVWVNTRSGIYHFQGERWFGNTKYGEYLCERDADREGDRPTHNGQ